MKCEKDETKLRNKQKAQVWTILLQQDELTV